MFKRSLIAFFSIIFAIYIVFHHHLIRIIIHLHSKIPFFGNTNHHLSIICHHSNTKLSNLYQYFSTLTNCSLSLMLSLSILNYHEHFLDLIVFCLHNVHHLFINNILKIPDYS